jgi:hypothetical protein
MASDNKEEGQTFPSGKERSKLPKELEGLLDEPLEVDFVPDEGDWMDDPESVEGDMGVLDEINDDLEEWEEYIDSHWFKLDY